MAESYTDPFDWSVDRIVHEFCRNPQPVWAPNNNPLRLSNAAALEQALRENDISGEPLLVLINQEILKTDLGIKSLGERYYIMRGIEALRNVSQKYHAHRNDQTVNFHRAGLPLGAGFISPQITHSNFTGYPSSPYPVPIVELQSGPASPGKNSIPELPSLFNTSKHGPQAQAQRSQDETAATQGSGTMMLHEPIPQYEGRKENQEQPTLPPLLVTTSETLVEDTKIDTTPVQTSGLLTKQAISLSGNAQSQLNPASGETDAPLPREHISLPTCTLVGGRKRLAPTFVSHLSKSVAPVRVDHQANGGSPRYLRRDAVSPEDIFYPDFNSEDENEEISHVQQGYSAGWSQYVSRLMRYYYQQPIRHIPQSKALAKVPYSRSSLKPDDSHYFTMFVPGLEPAIHNLLHWPALAAQIHIKPYGRDPDMAQGPPNHTDILSETVEGQCGSEDYDYLLEKYPPKDENEDLLALYGDSGDDGAYDLETWNEIDQDRLDDEREKKRDYMTKLEVEAAIEEALQQIIAEWRERKLAKTQLKGYRLWMRADRYQQRQAEMNNALYWVHRYDQTIKRMRETITKDVWMKVAEVEHQCKIFDEAVAQREEYKHFVTILSAQDAPPKPNFEALRKKDRAPRIEIPDDEEVLESDSDLGDFILSDDSSDVGSIPHDAPDFADTTEFLGPSEPVQTLTDSTGAQQELETSPRPLSEQNFTEPGIERTAEPDAPSTSRSEGDDNEDFAEVSHTSEDDIISPTRKAEMSRQASNLPATVIRRKAAQYLSGSDEAGDVRESAQDSDLDTLPPLPRSRYRPFGVNELIPVDLTMSSSPSVATPFAELLQESSSDYQVQTPELNPTAFTTPPKMKLKLNPPKTLRVPEASPSPARHVLKLGKPSLPSLADIPGIAGLDWEFLEERRDYKRILAKLVYQMNRGECWKIKAHLQKLVVANQTDHHGSQRHVSKGKFLDQIKNGLLAISAQTDINDGISPKKHNLQRIIRQLGLLYASYANHANLMDGKRFPEALLQHAFDNLHVMIKSFFDCSLEVLGYFCEATDSKLQGTKRKAAQDDIGDEYRDAVTTDANLLMLDTDEDHEASKVQETAVPSSIKKRKRKVMQSQEALSQQRSDQLRVQEEERRKALADMKLAKMGISGDNPAAHMIGSADPQIFLHEHIGKRVKPHQVEGIQFMWREIIANPKQQGCLLAHTMGLGKTMQVISLLVTISVSASSDDVRIRDQVPEHLRKTRTLILCPPSLIDNWHDELIMWRPYPEVLGKLYKIQNQPRGTRLSQMSQWANDGGILILSYELFRGLISNDGKKLSVEEHTQVQQDLLESPTIVVADEAHKMKNAGAKITVVASRFKTTSRIALTGSPLANNLEEYHTMIDWIHPGYLGTIVQFRAKYSDPISWGLYEDSTTSDKRLSLRKLITLGQDLGPKLNRADISAIEKEMPPKTEFFITLALTRLQIKAYNIYTNAVLKGNGTNTAANTRLWQWLHVLGLLCNHPLPFVNKLDERRYALEQKATPRLVKTMAATDESQGDALPTDVVSSDIGLSPDMIDQTLTPFRKLDEENKLDDPALSNRSLIVKQIVEESIKLGDKVLIFSHTIPTLDYLEKMLDEVEGCNPCRIDGETKMSTRQESTKIFNKKESAFNVFLISMKAGGLGLNLQGANRVIIYDFGFNPTWEDQAIGRAYRLGQKKSVFVYRFRAGGTFEDVTYNKAVFKTTLFSRVVDKKNYMSQAKKSLSSYLFDVKDVKQHKLEGALGKDRAVLDVIVRRTTCIRNIELTETFQKEDLEKLSEEEVQLAVEEFEDQRLQRDDPAAYARKLARKGAQQMMSLSTGSKTHSPGAAVPHFQSAPGMVSTSAMARNVMDRTEASASIPGRGVSYFDPQQAALLGHRSPAAWYAAPPIHQEVMSDTPAQIPTQQPLRTYSAGPDRVPQMDGASYDLEPEAPTNDQDSVEQQCRAQ